jgi:DNA primase
MDNWVDFKAVKAAVSMEQVLVRYSVSLRKVNATTLRGRCPLPTHGSKDSGNSFTVNTSKNVWSCMSTSCVAARGGSKGGNVLDLTAAMEKSTVRDAARKLAEWFMVRDTAPPGGQEPKPPESGVARQEPTVKPTEEAPAENKVLPFALKGITYCDYLGRRGISEETAAAFGVGLFPGRGTMSGRVVIPIQNECGELVAYAGRSMDGAEPKYKFPAGFHKSQVLFNLHRATGDTVIVVEGFFDCMNIYQSGIHDVVALMGSTLSTRQHELLLRFKNIVLFLDGDEPGMDATKELSAKLVYSHFVRAVSLSAGVQPDQLSSDDLIQLFAKLIL